MGSHNLTTDIVLILLNDWFQNNFSSFISMYGVLVVGIIKKIVAETRGFYLIFKKLIAPYFNEWIVIAILVQLDNK